MHRYFKRKVPEGSHSPLHEEIGEQITPAQVPSTGYLVANLSALPVDPGLRPLISNYDPNDRDEVRRSYLLKGPSHTVNHDFPYTDGRRFNQRYFKEFGSWLEYSIEKNATFCLYCYLFKSDNASELIKYAFSTKGFNNWQKQGERYKRHVGTINSVHKQNVDKGEKLMNQRQSIVSALDKQTDQAKAEYQTRVNTSVIAIRYLLFGGIPFRGSDESESSSRKGNFLKLVETLAKMNVDVEKVVLKNAPGNQRMIAPSIQKQMARACSDETIKTILKDIGDGYFSILVDESRDVSHKEQMALVLRYINKKGEVIERLIGLAHVTSTASESLKTQIYLMLSNLSLSYSRIRGQGYDGASNMRGHINGLQKKILDDCSSAHYVHCFAHQLQLTLVSIAHKNRDVEWLVDTVSNVLNVVGGSYKRRDEFRQKQAERVEEALLSGEKNTGKGLNQEMGLQRPEDTRWGSHFKTFMNMILLFGSIVDVLSVLNVYSTDDGMKASGCLDAIQTFEFVFLIHFMKNVLNITNALSQALQRRDQDIVNAISLIDTSKRQIQVTRDEGFDSLMDEVCLFCERYGISIPNMGDFYIPRGSRSTRRVSNLTNDHYFHYGLFYGVLDLQLQELNERFTEKSTELFLGVSCLNPTNSFSEFDKAKVLKMATYYRDDFDDLGMEELACELDIFIPCVRGDERFFHLNGLVQFSKMFVETKLCSSFPHVHLLLKLALLLPVSTATVERVFSAMKYIKSDLRSTISQEFLNDCVVPYVEHDIFDNIPDNDIMNSFQKMATRRGQFKSL